MTSHPIIYRWKKQILTIILLVTVPGAFAQTLLGIDFTPLSNKSVEFVLTFDEQSPVPEIKDDNQPARIIIDFNKVKLGLQKTSIPLNFDNLIDALFLTVKNKTRMIINLERLDRYQVGLKDKQLFLIIGVPDGSSDDFFTNSSGDRITAIKTGAYVSNYGGKFKGKPISKLGEKEQESDILWSDKSNNEPSSQIGSLKKGKRITSKAATDDGLPTQQKPDTEEVPEWDLVFEGFDESSKQSIERPKSEIVNPSQSWSNAKKELVSIDELSIVDFDFNVGDQNEAVVEMQFSSGSIDVDIQRHHRHVVFQFRNTILPDDLRLRFNVADFKTVAKLVDLDTKNLDAIVTIEVNDDYDYFIYQSETSYFIYLSENAFAPPQVRRGRNGVAYIGRKVSINLPEMDISDSIAQLTDFVGANAILSPNIQGTASLNLNNISWNKALDSFLAINGLASQWHNQTLFIAPQSEISQFIDKVQPQHVTTQLIAIQNANATEIQSIVKQSGLLSKQGKSVPDSRTNSLLINDYQDNIDQITDIVAALDKASDQVSIEARLVVVNTSYRKQLGINWSDNINLTAETQNLTTQPLSLAILNSTQLLDVELSAMENEGQGEVISKPKVITANNQHASIRSGQEFAIFNRDNDGNNTSTTFKQALLSLDVTPQITSNNQIKLQLSIAQDALSGFNNGIPIIDITNLDTTVSVGDGETIVLGGLYQISDSNDVEKVPYLNRIPLLGKLFKRKLDRKTKQEVLVFITPTILSATDQVVVANTQLE